MNILNKTKTDKMTLIQNMFSKLFSRNVIIKITYLDTLGNLNILYDQERKAMPIIRGNFIMNNLLLN